MLQGTYNRQRCRDLGNGRLFEVSVYKVGWRSLLGRVLQLNFLPGSCCWVLLRRPPPAPLLVLLLLAALSLLPLDPTHAAAACPGAARVDEV